MADDAEPRPDDWVAPLGEPYSPPPANPTAPVPVLAPSPLPIMPAEPMPTEPGLTYAEPPKRRWPTSAKVTTVLLVVLLAAVAAAGGFVYARERDNTKTAEDQRDSIAASDAEQIKALITERDKTAAELETASSSLASTQADLTKAQAEGASAAADLETATAQITTLKGLFPIDAQHFATAGLDGTYKTAELGAQACTLSPCPRPTLTLTVAKATNGYTVSDPQLGVVPLTLQGQMWLATGPVTAAALQGQCEAAAVPTTFTMALAPGSVTLNADDSVLVGSVVGNLTLSAPAATGASGAACPTGVAVYTVQAPRG